MHYGKVIEIPYSGGALDVLTKHKIGTVIEALESSPYGGMRLESIIGAK